MANEHNLNTEEVEQAANRLCGQYGNAQYFKWYCGAIYEFGLQKIEELEARVSDAKKPGRLFSKIVGDWRRSKRNNANKDRLHGKEN